MILLAEPKLLFFKPKKTAGTSVEIALSCNAGPQDIVTPILPADERVRHELGGQWPVNWAWRPQDEAAYHARLTQYLADGVIKPRWFGLKRGRLYRRSAAKWINHITPGEVQRRPDGARLLADSYVVTMCRHPYETVVSWASHLHADNGGDFARILDRAVRHAPLNEVYLFGARKPDFILRYEHLREDLATLEAKFGLTLCDKLPVTKGAARKDRRPASEILSPEQKRYLQLSHARSFEVFDYKP